MLPELIVIRAGTLADAAAIRELHVAVATISGGIARYADEITESYVHEIITRGTERGVIVVAQDVASGAIVGELHAHSYGLRRLAHVLTSLTVAVHPNTQGHGVGRRLFDALLHEVRENRPEILRVELITQASNTHARRLYESVGFRAEGELHQAILSTTTGLPETDVPMAWLRNPVV
ncbi:MAG: N-acetyltransferase [Gemmatimonadaceae bacterium]